MHEGKAKAKDLVFISNNLTNTYIHFNRGKIVEYKEDENEVTVSGKEVEFPMPLSDFNKYFAKIN